MIIRLVHVSIFLIEYGVLVSVLMERIANSKAYLQVVIRVAVFRIHPQVSTRITLSLYEMLSEPVTITSLASGCPLMVKYKRE